MAKKIRFKAGNMLYPLPAVMVSCGETPDEYNIITVAWTGTISTNPPMLYISLRPKRHSYEIIKRTGEFAINLTTEKLARITDFNGVKSGKDINKFDTNELTAVKAEKINTVIIDESPVNIECRVKQIMSLGSHDMFIADVVNVLADEQYLDNKTGEFRLHKAGLINYSHGNYFGQGKHLGHFGYSVRKKKRKRKK
jgi:flavin reductase (DIM6/NTAB) family NADH-FMN oxidoreductase RutF